MYNLFQPSEPIDTITFENALCELEVIVDNLQQGESSLHDTIAAYDRGIALKRYCKNELKKVLLKAKQVSLNEGIQPSGNAD
ncbi:exodeoxyribonuclease VII small subunit [Candidatus Endolissoclinum faulkneri]|nr:exodeoxyribonuclease VII small subunit [Candidatus Endolissoclinum faulkneri]